MNKMKAIFWGKNVVMGAAVLFIGYLAYLVVFPNPASCFTSWTSGHLSTSTFLSVTAGPHDTVNTSMLTLRIATSTGQSKVGICL